VIGVLIKHPPSSDVLLLTLLLYLIQSVAPVIFGLLVFCGEIPRARREHVVVCERVLLQGGKDKKNRRIEVVEWINVREIQQKMFGLEYSILCRSGDTLSLSMYENTQSLVDLLKTLSEIGQQ
jgi:hypothetical protein